MAQSSPLASRRKPNLGARAGAGANHTNEK
jgi:hypothetical protein